MTVGPAPTTTAPDDSGLDEALFVYGVVRVEGADDACHGLSGLDGRPVRLVRGGRLAAAVTDVALERPPGRRAELLAYQSVLDALAEAGPVVPVRFGSVLPDEETVSEELLLSQEDRLVAVLGDLEGRRQFNLRATYVEEAVLADLVASDPEIRRLRDHTRQLPEDAGYGERARLGELVFTAMQDRSAFDAAVLLDAVAPFAVEHLVRTPPSATQVLDVALLVDDATAPELLDRLEDLAEAVHERIRMQLVGPLAPYDFVEGTPWD